MIVIKYHVVSMWTIERFYDKSKYIREAVYLHGMDYEILGKLRSYTRICICISQRSKTRSVFQGD